MTAVTVICTFRNASLTIENTISSLKTQSRPDFNCLLINDASQDNSTEVAARAVGSDNRFHLIDNSAPGRAHALNLGVRSCETEWFAILDADDVVHPDWLATMLKVESRSSILGCRSSTVNNYDLPEWKPVGQPVATNVTRNLVRGNPLSHSGTFFSKIAVEAAGGYDVNRKSQFDYDLYVRVAEAGGTIAQVNQYLVSHRIHAGQSFEGSRAHASYVFRSVRVQMRAIRLLGRPTDYVWPLYRTIWATLPRSIRMSVRRIGGS
jgi:glycosyltransferase involved in cell wall biosynthesis